MSRIEKSKKREEFRKTYIYPIVSILTIFMFLLLIIDYRINTSNGQNTISIAKVVRKDNDLLVVQVFNNDIFNINTYYIRKDIRKLKNKVTYYSNALSNTILEAMKQY